MKYHLEATTTRTFPLQLLSFTSLLFVSCKIFHREGDVIGFLILNWIKKHYLEIKIMDWFLFDRLKSTHFLFFMTKRAAPFFFFFFVVYERCWVMDQPCEASQAQIQSIYRNQAEGKSQTVETETINLQRAIWSRCWGQIRHFTVQISTIYIRE